MHASKSRMSNLVSRLPRMNGFNHFASSNWRNNSLLPTYAAASSGERPRLSSEYFIRAIMEPEQPSDAPYAELNVASLVAIDVDRRGRSELEIDEVNAQRDYR
jgi:hypothetical protein